MVWGHSKPAKVFPIPEVIKTDYFRFQVTETPGNSVNYVELLKPEKYWCFTGVLFVTERPEAFRPHEDLAETIQSVKNSGTTHKEAYSIHWTGRDSSRWHKGYTNMYRIFRRLVAKN